MEVRTYRDDGTHYGDEIEKTDYFCPNCGVQNVYEEMNDGDYYMGATLYCLSCHHDFCMPVLSENKTHKFIV